MVAEAEDGEEAIAKAEELGPGRRPHGRPDAADQRHRGGPGIREPLPTTKILMLTVSDDEDDLYEAIKAGANGYLLKEISVEEVAEAIRAVVQGQSLISPSMASKLLSEFNALARQASRREQLPAPGLTGRESWRCSSWSPGA